MKCPKKEIDGGRTPEFDIVEEIESAAREPGRANEGGLAPGGIRPQGSIHPQPSYATRVNDVLAYFDGKETVVHVGKWIGDTRAGRAVGETKRELPVSALVGAMTNRYSKLPLVES